MKDLNMRTMGAFNAGIDASQAQCADIMLQRDD